MQQRSRQAGFELSQQSSVFKVQQQNDWVGGKDCLCCWHYHEKVCSVNHLVMPNRLEQQRIVHNYGFCCTFHTNCMLKQSARGQNESKGDLQISEELSPHDALQQHVQVCTVLEASHQVHHEAAVALCLNLFLSLHMCLDVSTEACAVMCCDRYSSCLREEGSDIWLRGRCTDEWTCW